MRLIVECEHGFDLAHYPEGAVNWCWPPQVTDPDAILAALAEAGVLEVERWSEEWGSRPRRVGEGEWTRIDSVRYVSPWKEAK